MSSEVPQIIGQASVAAAASSNVLAPGAGVSLIASSILLYNDNAGSSVVSVYARKAGAAKGAGTQVAAITVPGGATEPLKWGGTFGGDAGDILTVDAATNGIRVTVFGSTLTL